MLIGITGYIGSGKDTLASMLQDYLPLQNRKFADRLKQISAMLTGLPITDMYSEDGKKKYLPVWGMTVRQFQQRLGTDAIRRGLHEDAWVITAFADWHPRSSWVFTDVRFPNEVQAIHDRHGLIIRISRPGDSHESELHVPDLEADYEVQNLAGLSELRHEVRHVLVPKLITHFMK